MQARHVTGPEAASRKYDILTALGTHGLACEPRLQRLVLRLITLVTARYNWRQGVLQVGQREIARMWSVDERTVKREMAKLRDLGWVVVISPARRGRVATHALDLDAILGATAPNWPRVGPDFVARMAGPPEPATPEAPAFGTVVPFPGRAEPAVREAGAAGTGPWGRMQALLQDEDAAVYATWFKALEHHGGAGGEVLVLTAPSSFHASYVRTHYGERLLRTLRQSGGPARLRIVGPGEE